MSTLSTDTLTRQIAELLESFAALRCALGSTSRAREAGRGLAIAGCAELTDIEVYNISSSDPSRHQELHQAALQQDAETRLHGIVTDLARAMPILHQGDGLEISVTFGSEIRIPQLGLALNEARIGGRGARHTAEEAAMRLVEIETRIGHLAPGPRLFEFNGWHQIYAATPEDAYRTYAALNAPNLFTDPPADTARPSIRVHEVLPVSQLQAALQS